MSSYTTLPLERGKVNAGCCAPADAARVAAHADPADGSIDAGLIDLAIEVSPKTAEELARDLYALGAVNAGQVFLPAGRRFRMCALSLADRATSGRLVEVPVDLDDEREVG
jgi:hypothetical protein